MLYEIGELGHAMELLEGDVASINIDINAITTMYDRLLIGDESVPCHLQKSCKCSLTV